MHYQLLWNGINIELSTALNIVATSNTNNLIQRRQGGDCSVKAE